MTAVPVPEGCRPPVSSSQAGFALVQVAILVAIIGVIIGSTFAFLSPAQDKKHQALTMTRQRMIAVALQDYAQRFGVLPCPGDPAGVTPEAIGTARATCATAAARVGVVPFRTLGLSSELIVDGYDRPITYAVQSDASAANPGIAGNVYDSCRTVSWIGVGTVNRNPLKANFCCRAVANANRLHAYTNIGTLADSVPAQAPAPMTLQNVNTPSVSTGGTIAYIAYILVSHGKNGLGAYKLGTATRTATTGASAAEIMNATDDMDFADLPINLNAGANYFDDIVFWRTQQHVISETEGDSCAGV